MFLKRKLQKVTNYVSLASKHNKDSGSMLNNTEQSLQLNKLESHLLKLVIPFIRVGHCTRGSYIKVKGNLILISSDISHSMSRILTREQDLLPVCLKRKLEYTGNYLEEIIDRNKVSTYFSFFKRYNSLFKNTDLEENEIDEYEVKCSRMAKQFDEEITKHETVPKIYEHSSISDDEASSEDDFDSNLTTFFNPEEETKREKKIFFRDQSSVFCNKYEEDVSAPTVANRLANIIVEAEIHFGLEIDDEIEKEEFDDNVDYPERNRVVMEMDFEDELLNDESFFQEIMESDVDTIAKTSRDRIRNTLDKVSKIPIAPGEKGKFKNWGEDAFLEEKCFPELFPYGVGGYLSSLINDSENDIGFAMYVKHRILSADTKYRKNSTYLFFLLLVKELVQLKRCKQTYMRQATKLPNLTKESLKNIKPEDLSRYNRSYEVFKSMRGTSMYYEEAKRNVMAILRQNGSPSLFVTLSCAEYSWNGLIKEILETVHNKEFTAEYVEKLSPQVKNKLISENVVQSTLHFQKRIEKELKLMSMPSFFDDECKYRVSSYYYRVEFQQRGAPHIHSLLWLKDQDNKPAPTFWKITLINRRNGKDCHTINICFRKICFV